MIYEPYDDLILVQTMKFVLFAILMLLLLLVTPPFDFWAALRDLMTHPGCEMCL